MIKKLVCATMLTLPLVGQNKPLQLVSPLDQVGLFNNAIVNFMNIRECLKNLINGTLVFKGIESDLILVDASGNRLSDTLHVIVKRPEAMCGATFVVLAAHHPQIVSLVV